MSVGDGLRENGIMGHEIPVDIFEVLLLQNGEEKPCHLVVGAGHGGCKCCESIWGCRLRIDGGGEAVSSEHDSRSESM